MEEIMALRSHLVVKFHKPQKRTEVSTQLLNWQVTEGGLTYFLPNLVKVEGFI